MNIAFVADTGYGLISGASRSTQRFCRLLADKGHTVVILTSRKGRQKKVDRSEGVMIRRFSGVPLPTFNKDAYFALPFFYPVFYFLKKHRVEVLHVTEPTFLGFSAIVAARVLGIPVLVTSHIQSENVAYNTGMNKAWVRWIFNRYLVLFYSDANMIIFPSDFARRLLFPRGLKIPYKIISNGVELEAFRPRDARSWRKEQGYADTLLIVSVGRLMKEKRMDMIIRAMPEVIKKFPQARLAIIGDGLLKKKLQLLVRQMKLSKYVHLTGRISDEDLKMHYSAADLYVSASLVELEGMSILEAMTSGRPLIVANSAESAAPSLVRSNGFLFRPDDVSDLAHKIVTLLSNEELRHKFSQRSLALVKKCDIHRSVRDLEKAYEEAVRKNRSMTRALWNNVQKLVVGSK